MGAYLSEPMTTKESEQGEGNKLQFGACSMQGWRVSQEDAHNCIPNFDEGSSLFAVYDGHGGSEVAVYISRHLPEVLKSCDAYKNGEYVKALEECFLTVDASIKTPEVIKEIQKLAKRDNNEEATVDYEEENVGALYEEATMPLDKLVAKYRKEGNEDAPAEDDSDCKPGSSKSFISSPGSSKSPYVAGGSSSSSKSATNTSEKPGPTSSSACLSSTSSETKTDKNASTSTEVVECSSSTSTDEVKDIAQSSSTIGNEVNEAVGSSSKSSIKKEVAEPCSTNDVSVNECGRSSSSLLVNDIKETIASPSSTTVNELIVEGNSVELCADAKNGNEAEAVTSTVTSSSGPAEKPTTNGNGPSSTVKDENSVKVQEKAIDSSAKKPEKVAVNGSESSSDSKPDSSVEANASPSTPKKKKNHPVPVVVESNKPERRSPRNNKSQQSSGVRSFDYSDSDDSEEDDEHYQGPEMGTSDTSSDEDMEAEEEESSNDEDDDYEDDDEEDERFLNDIQEPGYDSGSTAVVCFTKWEADSLSVWVANAGDSRCVVCREGKAIDMSHDHKPELDAEAQRIVKAGGKVTEDGRVNGGLNLSRAIGDHSYKQNATLPPEEQMISPMPAIEHIVLNPAKDKFIVLACDGVWNSMSSQEVVDFVNVGLEKKEPLSKICEELFDLCLAPDTCGDGTGCDNMTAIIVLLSGSPEVFSGSKRRASIEEKPEDSECSKKVRID